MNKTLVHTINIEAEFFYFTLSLLLNTCTLHIEREIKRPWAQYTLHIKAI